MFSRTKKVAISKLDSAVIGSSDVEVYLLRLDLMDPYVSGNKWWKLKYNLKSVVDVGYDGLLTFGGAFSNHIAATAAAGKHFGIKTIGIIRGEEEYRSNPTLSFAEECGMQLHFVDRATYRRKEEPAFLQELKQRFGNMHIVPEGGANKLGVSGASEILEVLAEETEELDDFDFDSIVTAVGTGTTMAGLGLYLEGKKEVIGVPVMKGYDSMLEDVVEMMGAFRSDASINLICWDNHHRGGFGKVDDELIAFMREFYDKTKIKLDPIYTGKLMMAVIERIDQLFFKEGSRILVVHTGGLQGIAGMEQRLGYKIYED